MEIEVIIFYNGDNNLMQRTVENIEAQTVLPRRITIADTTDGPLFNTDMIKEAEGIEISLLRVTDQRVLMEHLEMQTKAAEFLLFANAGTTFSAQYLEKGLHTLRTVTDAAIVLADVYAADTGTTLTAPATLD